MKGKFIFLVRYIWLWLIYMYTSNSIGIESLSFYDKIFVKVEL